MDPSSTPPNGATSPEVKDAVERGKRTSQALSGILLIALGLIFLVDRVGWQWGWHVSFHRLWPILLIVAGLGVSLSHQDSEVVVSRDNDGQVLRDVRVRRRRYGDGLFLMLIGVLMLAHMNHWLYLSQSWPLFIVAAGLSVMFGRSRSRGRRSRREYR